MLNPEIRQYILSNAIGKGGAGKTTLFANVAGIAANSGWNALVVDCDPQGNMSLDLGVPGELTNNGAPLATAMISGGQPEVIRDVRPNLDFVAGGRELNNAIHHLHLSGDMFSLAKAIWPLAENYDIVFIDAPPGEEYMQKAILNAAGCLVIPMRFDEGSIKGLEVLGDRIGEIDVPLDILGISLSGLARGAGDMKARLRQRCLDIVPEIRIFDAHVHDAKKAAAEARSAGRLAYEYELEAQQADSVSIKERIAASREGRRVTYSTAAGPLAGDFHLLTDEILGAFVNVTQNAVNTQGAMS